MLYRITMSSGHGTVKEYMGGLWREDAEAICNEYNWHWVDENGFEWELDIEEDSGYVVIVE